MIAVTRETLEKAVNDLMNRDDIKIIVTDIKKQTWNIMVGDKVMTEGVKGNTILEDCNTDYFRTPDELLTEFAHIVSGMILLFEQLHSTPTLKKSFKRMNVSKCECGGKLVQSEFSGESTTLVGYSSPPGHDHDGNCKHRTYVCTVCGNEYSVSRRNRCSNPECDWRGKETCDVCGGGKLLDKWPDEE